MLIVAAFLASIHSKDEDLFVLTGAQKGRRKKPRMSAGSLSVPAAGGEEGVFRTCGNDGGPTPLVNHLTVPQSFSLDRLTGIYSQVAISIDGSLFTTDGKSTCRADVYCNEISSSFSPHHAAVMDKPTLFSSKIVGRFYGDTSIFSNVNSKEIID